MARFDTAERPVVLDLGAASTATLALLGQSHCRVEIVDLAHFVGVDTLNTAEPGTALANRVDAILPQPSTGDAYDRVLCWDLPNYLTLDALSALMGVIGRRARPGALAHALVFYAQREMPDRPGRLVPSVDGELTDLNDVNATIAAPRYSPEQLGEAIIPFSIERARLLGNGMQEFLFRLKP